MIVRLESRLQRLEEEQRAKEPDAVEIVFVEEDIHGNHENDRIITGEEAERIRTLLD